VFRTNTSYKRWEEASDNWSKTVSQSRNILRLASSMMTRSDISKQRQVNDLKRLAVCLWAFLRTMKRELSSEKEDQISFLNEIYEKLPKQQADVLLQSKHRPIRALQDVSYAIEMLNMNEYRRDEISHVVTTFENSLGGNERLLSSPVPIFYTRHTVRFLFAWISLLPLALYSIVAKASSPIWNSVLLIPMMYFLSMFLFGIDEIAMQCEEPFSILPQQKFCDKVYRDCMEIASFEYELVDIVKEGSVNSNDQKPVIHRSVIDGAKQLQKQRRDGGTEQDSSINGNAVAPSNTFPATTTFDPTELMTVSMNSRTDTKVSPFASKN
jgi:ion channel-forming bestrophin family protein